MTVFARGKGGNLSYAVFNAFFLKLLGWVVLWICLCCGVSQSTGCRFSIPGGRGEGEKGATGKDTKFQGKDTNS